ncbi:UNVERIFIED_CONTAM: hypothetical protein DV099_10580 [Bifidobacterium longum]|nr:hypothetical protein [Bifidobacterium longum]
MAGFAFPRRVDNSLAQFDFGKLFFPPFLARGVIQLTLDALAWLGRAVIAQPGAGRAPDGGAAAPCAPPPTHQATNRLGSCTPHARVLSGVRARRLRGVVLCWLGPAASWVVFVWMVGNDS